MDVLVIANALHPRNEDDWSLSGRSQGAVAEVGRGRVAVFGEAAMFSAQLAGPQAVPAGMNTPVASQNARLPLNLARWLGGSPTARDEAEVRGRRYSSSTSS